MRVAICTSVFYVIKESFTLSLLEKVGGSSELKRDTVLDLIGSFLTGGGSTSS